MTLDLSPAAGEAEFGDPAEVGDFAEELPKMLSGAQTPPWCSYAVREDGHVVGMGGFKGDPDQGAVEIGYLTLKSHEGRGIAGAVAARLVAIAADAGVGTVVAHTLPEDNPSTLVLRSNGFAHVGVVDDPDDGPVWRWEKIL